MFSLAKSRSRTALSNYRWSPTFGQLLSSLALAGSLLTGCATVTVSGYVLNAGQWEGSSAEVRRIAAFDLQCDPKQLDLQVMRVGRIAYGMVAAEIGVTGCGRHERYRATEQGWRKG